MLEDYHSLSKAWEHCIFFTPSHPMGVISYHVKSINRNDGNKITVSTYNNDHISPYRMSFNGLKDNVLSLLYKPDEQKAAEFLKEDAIKKAIANDLKEIENLDMK